jgi:hypothetical protein
MLPYDHYRALYQSSNATLNDAHNRRIALLLEQLPGERTRIIEIGPSSGYTASILRNSGHEVLSLAGDYPEVNENPNHKTTNGSSQSLSFHAYTQQNAQDRFNVCILQERLPYPDTLDIFNRTWKLLKDEGYLILFMAFTKQQHPSLPHNHPPILSHLLRQAQDCGFQLESQTDFTGEALSGFKHDNHTYRLIKLSKAKRPRWLTRLASSNDLSALQKLFQDAFAQQMDPLLWAWKYYDGRGVGVVAETNDELVAHYGGILRPLLFHGNKILGVQISDVMVSPKERGILTRKGAFYRVAAAFPEYYVGYGSTTLIGYGFPNSRHMRIAEAMQLYREVGRISELIWRPQATIRPKHISSRALDIAKDQRRVEKLWLSMAGDLRQSIVGIRDTAYLKHRYFDHPTLQYRTLLIYHRYFRTPLGIVVLHQVTPETCRLIDLVSPIKHIPTVINQALEIASDWGCLEMHAWGSEQVTAQLAITRPEVRPTDICIPTSIWTNGPDPETINGTWWLMLGDTDFN